MAGDKRLALHDRGFRAESEYSFASDPLDGLICVAFSAIAKTSLAND